MHSFVRCHLGWSSYILGGQCGVAHRCSAPFTEIIYLREILDPTSGLAIFNVIVTKKKKKDFERLSVLQNTMSPQTLPFLNGPVANFC